jgi:pyruvate formate lyase activating enzyme
MIKYFKVMKESYLYKKFLDKRVQCQTCSHYCVILPQKRGICGVRENQAGKLYVLNYEKLIACNIDPIEKKPFFHFLPGSHSLSIATVGCNLKCENCQNYEISQLPKLKGEIPGEKITPKKIVNLAIKNNLPSISYTYTEPTIFLEYALDTMKIAKKKGLKNAWVTNGFLSKETLKLIYSYLDAANVDLKGFSEEFYQRHCGARLKSILDNLIEMKKRKIWVEITTLAIPTLSEDLEMFKRIAKFIKKNLGSETPWHITQFSGVISWKLQRLPPTSPKTLQNAWEIGKNEGLKYVYTGNIPGLASEDTICPHCQSIMINRNGYLIKRFDKNGKCSKCGENLNLILK